METIANRHIMAVASHFCHEEAERMEGLLLIFRPLLITGSSKIATITKSTCLLSLLLARMCGRELGVSDKIPWHYLLKL
jgi:hypothetical protein